MYVRQEQNLVEVRTRDKVDKTNIETLKRFEIRDIHFFEIVYFIISDDIQKDVDDKSKAEVGELKFGNYAKLQLKQKHFDCKLLFESKVHDLPAPSFMSKPFKDIPDLLKADYLYDRRIKKNEWYIEENFPTNRTSSKFCNKFLFRKELI